MPFAEVDHLLIDPGKSALRHDGLHFLESPIGTIHLAAVTDHGGHGGIHNHVVRRVKVRDAFRRVHHRQLGPMFVAGMKIAHDFLALTLRQGRDFVVEIDHAVIDIHAEFFQDFGMFFKGLFVKNLDAVAKDNRMRDLHHGGLHMQREHHAGFAGVLDLALIKLAEGLATHKH